MSGVLENACFVHCYISAAYSTANVRNTKRCTKLCKQDFLACDSSGKICNGREIGVKEILNHKTIL